MGEGKWSTVNSSSELRYGRLGLNSRRSIRHSLVLDGYGMCSSFGISLIHVLFAAAKYFMERKVGWATT